MKKTLILLFLFGLVACKPETTSNQSERIVIEDSDYDFGVVPDTVRNLSHKFKITNNSSDTCKILRIEKSCGCTKVKINDDTILPFSSISLDVDVEMGFNYSFFEREINIFTNFQESPLTIYVRASRSMPIQLVSKEFPVKITEKLRLNIPYLVFGNICFGESKSKSIDILNTDSTEAFFFAKLQDAPSYVNVSYERKAVPNEIGRIIITIDLTNVTNIWGLQRYNLRIGSGTNIYEIPIEAIFTEKTSRGEDSPRLVVPVRNYTIDTSNDTLVKFLLKNIGDGVLHIWDIKTNGIGKMVSSDLKQIMPEKEDTLSYSLKRNEKGTVIIGISTNDPVEPYREFRIFCKPSM